MTLTLTNVFDKLSFLNSIPFINLFSDEPEGGDIPAADSGVDLDADAFEVEVEDDFDVDGDLSGAPVKKSIGYDFDENEIDNYDKVLYGDDEEDDELLPPGYHVDEGGAGDY